MLPEEWRPRQEDSVLSVLCARACPCPEEQRPARFNERFSNTFRKKHLVVSLLARGTFPEELPFNTRLLSNSAP